MANAFRSAYDLAFQVSPIILQGGLAANVPGGMLPIIGLVGQLAGFAQGALSSGGLSADDFFARFVPIPGGNIINNAVGMYPFANQQIAANAIIEQPLSISLMMIAPVKDAGGYITKLPIFTALRTSLEAHNNSGGTYAVATPAFIYTNCIMVGMTDVTTGETKQKQTQWQLDFHRPLITSQEAQSSYSGLMSKLTKGSKLTTSKWSGPEIAAGKAVQGAAQNVSGLAGAVNSFLGGPAL